LFPGAVVVNRKWKWHVSTGRFCCDYAARNINSKVFPNFLEGLTRVYRLRLSVVGQGGRTVSVPGQIHVIAETTENLMALLYDFDVDSSALKPEHIQWLEKTVTPYRNRDMTALIIGLASRTGSNDWNLSLSRRRAASVSSQLFVLKPTRFLTEARVAVGEEAAKIAGLQDRVEDGRWRSVFINIHDPKRILPPPPPPPKPVKSVWRRTWAKVLVSDKPGKYVIQDKEGKRSEQIYQASRKFLQSRGILESIVDYRTGYIFETWTVTVIRLKRTDYKDGAWEFKSFEVTFEWGPPGGERVFHDLDKNRLRPINADEMNDWLHHPTKTFVRM
jgi:hypothetical protein